MVLEQSGQNRQIIHRSDLHNDAQNTNMTTSTQNHFHYAWRAFAQLTVSELYHLLKLRQQVFVVEQRCPYLDADGLDAKAVHLLCRQTIGDENLLVGCLRVLAPGKRFATPAIGRLATAASVRGQGVGRRMMQQALYYTAQGYPGQAVTISAQLYLEKFYRTLGFSTHSDPYDEDGIMHIDMIYTPCTDPNR